MSTEIERIAATLAKIAEAMQELRSLGVLRSRKLAPDFSEWLVTQLFGGKFAESKTQKGWDVYTHSEQIQGKMSFVPDDPANRWSYVGDKHPFDALVLVVLSDTFRVRELYKIPQRDLLPLLKPDKQAPRLN